MSQYSNCTNCFAPLNQTTVCSCCGNDCSQDRKYKSALPAFTVLNNRYLVGRTLGKGGFGVTYIAKDMQTNRIQAVKEYMPSEYSTRTDGATTITPLDEDKAKRVFVHGKEKFVEEAKTLIKLQNNPVVVDICDFFTQNNTAYLVMEYLDGIELHKYAKMQGGTLNVEFAKKIFVTVASSLIDVHKLNILHRDISPENIMILKNGQIKLIDFGAARNYVSTQNQGMSILLKPGFAPPEQYNRNGKQGPWSDIYALCATFYKLVSGKPLVDALFRYRGETQPSLYSLGCNVTKKTSDVIEKGMELDYQNRYADFKALLNDLDGDVTPIYSRPPQSVQQVRPVQPAQQMPPVQQVQPVKPAQQIPPMQQVQPVQPVQQIPPMQQVQPVQPVQQIPPMQQVQPMQSAQQIPPMQQVQPVKPVQQIPPMQQVQPVKPAQQIPPVQPVQPVKPVQQIPPMQQVQPVQPVQTMRPVTQQQPQTQAVRPFTALLQGNQIVNKAFINVNDYMKIGRSPQSCQMVISGDTNISRIHCYIRFDGMNLYITDVSANGTFLENGTRLQKNVEQKISMGTRFYLATRNNMIVVSV